MIFGLPGKTFAVLLALSSGNDMYWNYCPTACFAPSETVPSLSLSAGKILDNKNPPGYGAYIRYNSAQHYGPYGFAGGLSIEANGQLWAGYGITYDLINQPYFYTQLHLMPGLYYRGNGFDLGGALEFRSGIEAGIQNSQHWRLGLSYDHRSNAGLYRINTGIETFQLRLTIPLDWDDHP